MPNGKPGDHPFTDMFHYGSHPFPPDIEALILELKRLDPHLKGITDDMPFDWEEGKNLEVGRRHLKGLIEKLRGK